MKDSKHSLDLASAQTVIPKLFSMRENHILLPLGRMIHYKASIIRNRMWWVIRANEYRKKMMASAGRPVSILPFDDFLAGAKSAGQNRGVYGKVLGVRPAQSIGQPRRFCASARLLSLPSGLFAS